MLARDVQQLGRAGLSQPRFPLAFCRVSWHYVGITSNTKLETRQYRSSKSFSAVAANLRALRTHRTQAEFAAFLGIPNQVTYHRYEKGRLPHMEILHAICLRLEISVDEMLSPIPAERASEIAAKSLLLEHGGKLLPVRLSEESYKAFGRAGGELINPKSLKAIRDAFDLEKLSRRELTDLFSYHCRLTNRVPVGLIKFYVLVRCAIGMEVVRRHKIMPKGEGS